MSVSTPIGKVMLTPKDAWSSATAYAVLDIVTYQGTSYVAKQTVPAGTLPTVTNYWQQLCHKGDTGNGIAHTTLNADYTLTITYTDGTSETTASIRGATGNGISNAVLNADYTLTLTFTDGNTYTTPSIRGATGNVYYATFEIDMDTGMLKQTTPDGMEEIDFSINSNGDLEVSI